MANTHDGTDIQVALTQGLALIAQAQIEHKRTHQNQALAQANIILASDGGSVVDLPALRQARDAIDRQTPVQIMFAAINGTNETLRKLDHEIQDTKLVDDSLYREFEREVITRYLAQSKAKAGDLKQLAKTGKHYFTEKQTGDIPQAFHELIHRARQQLPIFMAQLQQQAQQIRHPADLLQQLDRDIPWKTRAETRPNPELTNNLRLLRGLLNSPAFAEDATLFASVVDDLIHHMPALADIPIEQFTREEFGHLEHLLKHAAGQETGLGEQLP